MENKKVFSEKTKLSEIPAGAFEFTMPAELAFEKSDDDTRKLRLQLYDGTVQKHWYWGNFAFELSGMRLAKKKVGILDSHDTSKRIGVGEKAETEGRFVIEGKALDNENARSIIADADAGFPFEASLRFDPARSRAVFIKEGQTVTVNGNKLASPGTLFTKTTIVEGSVCVFGHLTDCMTEAFEIVNENQNQSNQLGDTQMAEKQLTVDSLKAEHEDIYNKIFQAGVAEGEKKERDRFAEIAELAEGDHELAIASFNEGRDNEAILKARNAKLAAALKASEEAAAQNAQQAGGTGQEKVDPAVGEFTDDAAKQPAKGDEKKMTDEQLKEKFNSDEKLQAEFGHDVASYIAFIKAEKNGQVEILEK